MTYSQIMQNIEKLSHNKKVQLYSLAKDFDWYELEFPPKQNVLVAETGNYHAIISAILEPPTVESVYFVGKNGRSMRLYTANEYLLDDYELGKVIWTKYYNYLWAISNPIDYEAKHKKEPKKAREPEYWDKQPMADGSRTARIYITQDRYITVPISHPKMAEYYKPSYKHINPTRSASYYYEIDDKTYLFLPIGNALPPRNISHLLKMEGYWPEWLSHLCFPIKLVRARLDIPLFYFLVQKVKPNYNHDCFIVTAKQYPKDILEYEEELDYLEKEDILDYYKQLESIYID